MPEQMTWFNRPEKCEWKENSLSFFVTPKTDYWRITHYGFTVDDGPFLYGTRGGEFEVQVRLAAEFQALYDQLGLMLRYDEKTWIKAGIEYVNEKMHLSVVVTHNTSDWSVTELPGLPVSVWLKAIRELDSIQVFFSLDGTSFSLLRMAWFPAQKPVQVGMYAASPDGDGFQARFDDYKITHRPDSIRLRWLKDQQDKT